MPKLDEKQMARRRAVILQAARRCFARKGFGATTIADICAESGLSAGGLYTHFPSKHAIVAAIGRQSSRIEEPVDPLATFDALHAEPGLEDARLDLHLWAEALTDDALRALVCDAMDAHRAELATLGAGDAGHDAWVVMLEALALGLEVQRALGRPSHPRLRDVLEELLEATP